MKQFVLALSIMIIAACIPPEPLRPGQTRCESKKNFFGVVETECETGQPAPLQVTPPQTEVERTIAEPKEVHGFWCSTSASDYTVAFCARDRDVCAQVRDSGPVDDMGRCVRFKKAWCNDRSQCAPTAEACGLSGSECTEAR